MSIANRYAIEDLPDLPLSRELKSGFPLLTFTDELEEEFKRTHFACDPGSYPHQL
jgi:hypothetical protein